MERQTCIDIHLHTAWKLSRFWNDRFKLAYYFFNQSRAGDLCCCHNSYSSLILQQDASCLHLYDADRTDICGGGTGANVYTGEHLIGLFCLMICIYIMISHMIYSLYTYDIISQLYGSTTVVMTIYGLH